MYNLSEGSITWSGETQLTQVPDVGKYRLSRFNRNGSIKSLQAVLYAAVKRFIDITLSLISLAVLLPVFLATALAIKLDSNGPVFYAQFRAGINGRPFRMFKFRSMCADADLKQKELLACNEKDGPIFKIMDDPRVTRVGRFIRRFSIDELPQFINVLYGHMSLVGPRPPLLSEVEQYQKHHLGRLVVKPGLTCYWQISGRSNISFDEWVRLDLAYINNRTILVDIKILLLTIPAVLSGKGAY